MLKFQSKLFWYIRKSLERFSMHIYSYQFKYFGKNALFHPFSTVIKGYENISLGDFSTIGPNSVIYSIDSNLIIGKKTGLGPNSVVITGNHSTHLIGKFYKDYHLTDKLESDDADVIIEDDIWIGASCTILKGAHLRRGSIVGAASLINSHFPPYSIIYGSPAKFVKFRFTINQILEHEKILYPKEERYPVETLDQFYKEYGGKEN